MRGAITYEIKPGTIITSASGDMIDTSKIGTEKLDMVKKQQAKKKYEKKMKNRGTLKK